MIWDRKYVHFLGVALEALPEEKRRLGTLCLLAALAHVLAFFVLHISYPTSIPVHNSPTHITLFTPELVDEDSWHRKKLWYDLNDPSRLIRIQADWLGNDPLDIHLEQSPEPDHLLVLLPADSKLVFLHDLDPLPQRALASLFPAPQTFHYEIPNKPLTSSYTVTEWEEPSRSRWIGDPWKLPEVTSDLLDQTHVTVLQLGVNGRGEVEHVLVESSSGKSDIDLLAVDSARKLRFQPLSAAPIQWGRVSIFWKFTGAPPENASSTSGSVP